MRRTFIPRSLFGRALIILIVPIILVQLVTNFVFLDRHLDSVTKLLAENIVSLGKVLGTLQQDPHTPLSQIEKFAQDFHASYTYHPDQRLFEKIIPPKSWAEAYLIAELDHALPFAYTLVHNDQYLIVSMQLPEGVAVIKILRKRLMSKTTQLVFYWAIGISIIAVIVAALFMRKQVAPLLELADATEKFGMGRLHEDVKVQGATEIRKVTKAFNGMRDRIKRQVNQRTEMLAGISHDLRTPLTRMKLELELFPKDKGTQELRTDVLEMENMVNEYLDFVRQDTKEKIQQVNLTEMITALTARLQSEKFSVTMTTRPHPLFIMARPLAFKRCLKNLLVNASRYATKATINAWDERHDIVITIDDNGTGIPPEKRQEVFKAFYRLDASRNPQTGGLGLGLSIVQDIIHSHGGRVSLDDAPAGGLRVIIKLPI